MTDADWTHPINPFLEMPAPELAWKLEHARSRLAHLERNAPLRLKAALAAVIQEMEAAQRLQAAAS